MYHLKYGDIWRYSPPGGELIATFETKEDLESKFRTVSRKISGIFGTSQKFSDLTISTQPFYAEFNSLANTSQRTQYSSLPREPVCTENLTPWLKLLPCRSKAGLASLLNPIKLYDLFYHSMSVEVTRSQENSLSFHQELLLIVELKEFKFSQIFGTPLIGPICPFSSQTKIQIEGFSDYSSFTPTPEEIGNNQVGFILKENLKNKKDFNLYYSPKEKTNNNNYNHNKDNTNSKDGNDNNNFNNNLINEGNLFKNQQSIKLNRFLMESGKIRGGVITQITNLEKNDLHLILYDSLPWFMRVYFHTLKIKSNFEDKEIEITNLNLKMKQGNESNLFTNRASLLRIQTSQDHGRPSIFELALVLKPGETFQISVDYLKGFLNFEEHPSDGNRGFDIAPAIALIQSNKQNLKKRIYYTDSLLLMLPTPDFTMPYNVMTITTTAFLIWYGSFLNNLTGRAGLKLKKKSKAKWIIKPDKF
ncbi:gpi transamidase component pig-t-related [Anaeramoeba flamelloides]|uniref:Gpi transamidase component pig-t-related n=1 Tax=Anaeramoeba flamelloides TaxID=1746091 RepID=A0AAV7YI41_9EUKA|nr:gpi transamidase component pig-t-related [Anaeramoeba flamelloides]